MAKRSGMYKSGKRQKELLRKKKQEEKRLKRQKGVKVHSEEAGAADHVNREPESSENTPEAKE